MLPKFFADKFDKYAELAENENIDDFWTITEIMLEMRAANLRRLVADSDKYWGYISSEDFWKAGGTIICWLFKPKPDNYKRKVKMFRTGFAGIFKDADLRYRFRECVLPPALEVLKEKGKLITIDDLDLSDPTKYFDLEGFQRIKLRTDKLKLVGAPKKELAFD